MWRGCRGWGFSPHFGKKKSSTCTWKCTLSQPIHVYLHAAASKYAWLWLAISQLAECHPCTLSCLACRPPCGDLIHTDFGQSDKRTWYWRGRFLLLNSASIAFKSPVASRILARDAYLVWVGQRALSFRFEEVAILLFSRVNFACNSSPKSWTGSKV